MQFTRNPASLIDALEALRDDPTQIHSVTRATAPLWLEVPEQDGRPLLDARIAALRDDRRLRAGAGAGAAQVA